MEDMSNTEQAEQAEETRVQAKTWRSLTEYEAHSMRQVQQRKSTVQSRYAPDVYSEYFEKKFDAIEEGIASNGFFLKEVSNVAEGFVIGYDPEEQSDNQSSIIQQNFYNMCASDASIPMPLDREKVIGTLKQLYREWSSEGAKDREACFDPILRALQEKWPDMASRKGVRVLVPGCGLGRLPFEIAALGFNAQGNEFSYHMIFTSCMILNCVDRPNAFRIYPFIHSYANHRTIQSQVESVNVPDVDPQAVLLGNERAGSMSFASGSFEEIYPGPTNTKFHAICTSFFIDTSPDIFKTLHAIYQSLEDDGVWVNFGPLLWHFEDSEADNQYGAELTLDQLVEAAEKMGFKFIESKSQLPCHYTRSGTGTLGGYVYECEYWVATKKQ